MGKETEQKEGEMEKERRGFRRTEGERRVGGKPECFIQFIHSPYSLTYSLFIGCFIQFGYQPTNKN